MDAVFPLTSAPEGEELGAYLVKSQELSQENEQNKMSKPCHIFFQNKDETQIFTINKRYVMKKSKYQQYFHCVIFFILVPYSFWSSYWIW